MQKAKGTLIPIGGNEDKGRCRRMKCTPWNLLMKVFYFMLLNEAGGKRR